MQTTAMIAQTNGIAKPNTPKMASTKPTTAITPVVLPTSTSW
ncbi:MAG: hypothetical protein QOE69_515 [Thermoleophilaceae bacterium]|nr:hypothetical protein [Thermoleophilaceae bacterium]